MSTNLKLFWRTNILLKLYNDVTIPLDFSSVFSLMTTGDFSGQYNVDESTVIQAFPRGFLLSYPQLVMLQIFANSTYTPYLCPNIFRRWCSVGPAYIITASEV